MAFAQPPSMMQWPPTMGSSQHCRFPKNLPSASGTTGVKIDDRILAGPTFPFNVGVPQMDANTKVINAIGLVSPMRPHTTTNSIQQRSRNEINFHPVNRTGAVGKGFARRIQHENLAMPEMGVRQGLINDESGVGAENQMRPHDPLPQDADNPILIEIQRCYQDQRYRDVMNHIKPLYSTVTLIAMAIENAPAKMVTVAEIYQFIIDLFPFYRNNTNRWQNTVRNTLSTEDCFIKNDRPEGYPGTGKVWSLHPDSTESFQNGQLRRKKAFKNETKAKRPRLDPTHQIQLQGMRNKPIETETNKIQDAEMTSPVHSAATAPVNVYHSSHHHPIYARATQYSRFSSGMVRPVQAVASLCQYALPYTVTHTNGHLFPDQHCPVETDNQFHNHNESGGCSEFEFGVANNNAYRFKNQNSHNDNNHTHTPVASYTRAYSNVKYTSDNYNTPCTSSAIAGSTEDETWNSNDPYNPLSYLPSMFTVTSCHNSENTDQQRYKEPLSQFTKLVGYTDQDFEDIFASN